VGDTQPRRLEEVVAREAARILLMVELAVTTDNDELTALFADAAP
jgi:hypothetical protein